MRFRILLTALLLMFTGISVGCGEDEVQQQKPPDHPYQRPIQPSIPVDWSVTIGRKLPEKMVVQEDEVLLADSIGNIVALDIADGGSRTVIHLPGPIMGWDISERYIASSSISKHIHFNDMSTGEELWSTQCETTPGEPAITRYGVIFVEGLGPYRVRHHSLEDGSQLWQREFDVKPGGYAPVLNNANSAFIAFEDGTVRAFNIENGSILGEFKVGSPLELDPEGRWKGRYDFLGAEGERKARLAPVHPGGVGRMLTLGWHAVIPSEDGHLYCMDFINGTIRWENDFGERVILVWEDENYFYAETAEGNFHRIDRENGELLHSVHLDNPTSGFVSTGIGIIVDTSDEDELIVRSGFDLREISRIDAGFIPVDSVITVGAIIMRTNDGRIITKPYDYFIGNPSTSP